MRSAPTPRLSSTGSIILANLVPLVGVLVFAWDPLLVLLLYWIEFYFVILLNTPKIMLASADRSGRLPDDIAFGSDGPLLRLGNAWLAVVSFVVYTLFYLVITGISPLWDVLVDVSILGTDPLILGTLLVAGLSMAVSYLLSFRDEFVGNAEYETVTPGVQLMRPFGKLWVFLLVLLFASGLAVFDENPTALVSVLIVLKSGGDILARRLVRIQPPAIEQQAGAQPPDASPVWTGRPNLRALLVPHGLIIGLGSIVAVLLVVGLYGVALLDLLGWPFYGTVVVGGSLVTGILGLFGAGVAITVLRYRSVEYRVYSTGVSIYNTRHGTFARFVPFRNIDGCTAYRGVFGRLFGTGLISIRLSDAPRGGRFRTVFSSGSQRSSSGDETREVVLRAVSDPQAVIELIERYRR